ncbi:ABC transporter ATP-binding protein [Patulibacter americanus]|uniref:ABC transporter ATP-binding protein n=1 Tax=Patulibacter americanus TaxID=588672 RepID=UPI0004004BB4|nr:ABC transporter ATP-binding protein [Patulibacter americanus]
MTAVAQDLPGVADATTDALLSVDGLRVEFGPADAPLVAVKDVGLTIAPGEIVGLIGESGSGKSLTCRSIMRLIGAPGRVTAGTVDFEGRDVLAMSSKELRDFRAHDVGMIYQDPFSSLNPVMRIGDHLRETLRANRGMSKAEARAEGIALLERVGIPDPERRYLSYPHELSGGMRQRVMIALATASRPRLLLADEPTTALDVTTQAQILDLLTDMRRELGMAVLVVSHDFGVIAQVCDRVCVMYGGHVVETGPVERIYADPQHPYTKALLDSVPDMESAGNPVRREGIPGYPPELTDVLPGCVFAPRCAHARPGCTSVPMVLQPVDAAAPDAGSTACPVRPFSVGGPFDPVAGSPPDPVAVPVSPQPAAATAAMTAAETAARAQTGDPGDLPAPGEARITQPTDQESTR